MQRAARTYALSPVGAGQLSVEILIWLRTGEVIDAATKRSTVENAALETCILEKVRRWRFPKGAFDGGTMVLIHPFALGADSTESHASEQLTNAGSTHVLPGLIGHARESPATREPGSYPAVVRRTIRGRIDQVRGCYEKHLALSPDLAGRVAVRFTVSPTGDVSTAGLHESTMGSPAVEACIVEIVRRWRFPKRTGGGSLVVTYPFNFSPG